MRRRACAVLVVAAAIVPASARQFTPNSTVSYTLSWAELGLDFAPVVNPDGVLQRGERALLRLTVSFDNQNTIATFSPPVGTFTSGTIRGFGSAFIDLIGSAPTDGARGGWNVDQSAGFGVDEFWDLVGPQGHGTPANQGSSLLDLQMGQFPQIQTIRTQNPIPDIWRGVWTPESYMPRDVSFRADLSAHAGSPYSSALVLRIGSSQLAFAACGAAYGSVQIPVVPGPSTFPSFLAVGLWTMLQRRRAQRDDDRARACGGP